MGEADREIGRLSATQHGLVTRRQLLDLGLGEGAVERRLARRVLIRIHRGVYAFGHPAPTREMHWMAAVLACGPEAALSHRSAGQLWRIVPHSEARPEVTRPHGFRGTAGIRCHDVALPADELTTEAGIAVTEPARTLFDLASVSSPQQLERAFKELEVRQLTSRLSIPQLLERHPGRRGARLLRQVLALRSPDDYTVNAFEELLKSALSAHGIERPEFNGALWLRGRFFHPDAIWRRQRLMLELDGREVHETSHAFQSDRQRDRILLAEGWRTIHVTWRQLHREPDEVMADIRRSLAR